MRVGTCYFKTETPLQPIQLPQWPSWLHWQLFQLPPPMPPTYSLPPVSPTQGDQIELSMVTSGAQGPGLVSPSKTRQGTQFGLRATYATGQFPLPQYLVRGEQTSLHLRHLILISPQGPG